MCSYAVNIGDIDFEWEGTMYSIKLAPHDMTDNRIVLDEGYLVNLEVLDFPLEFWNKEHISAAFFPYGAVTLIEQASLTGAEFSSISLVLHVRRPKIPRKLMIMSDGIGIIIRIVIKGFIDLNNQANQPFYPVSSSEDSVSRTLSVTESEDTSLPNFAFPCLQENHRVQTSTANSLAAQLPKSPDFLRLSPMAQTPIVQVAQENYCREVLHKITPDPTTPAHHIFSSQLLDSPMLLSPRQLNFSGQHSAQEEEDFFMVSSQALEANTDPMPQQEQIVMENEKALNMVQQYNQAQEEGMAVQQYNQAQAAGVEVQALEGPRRSTRISKQTKGMYINIVEKAMKKKQREKMLLADAKRKKARKGKATQTTEDVEETAVVSSPPPILTAEQMLELGKDMGFDEDEECEIRDAVGLGVPNE